MSPLFVLDSFSEYVSPIDRAARKARKLRARHWLSLRRAATHYGMADAVARALLIVALLIVGTLAAGCEGDTIYYSTSCRDSGEWWTSTNPERLPLQHEMLAPSADEHAPWCPRVGCTGGCWGSGAGPRDTTRVKNLPRWSVQTPWPGGWPWGGGWQY